MRALAIVIQQKDNPRAQEIVLRATRMLSLDFCDNIEDFPDIMGTLTTIFQQKEHPLMQDDAINIISRFRENYSGLEGLARNTDFMNVLIEFLQRKDNTDFTDSAFNALKNIALNDNNLEAIAQNADLIKVLISMPFDSVYSEGAIEDLIEDILSHKASIDFLNQNPELNKLFLGSQYKSIYIEKISTLNTSLSDESKCFHQEQKIQTNNDEAPFAKKQKIDSFEE